MEITQFLQQLRVLSLEDGRRFITANASMLDDHAAFGMLLADEALDQSYANPTISLKLAELLIFFGDECMQPSSRALGLKAKGDMLKTIGLHRAALACLDEAGEVFLRLGDEGNWARSRISWIISCAWLGETERALREADRARETFLRIGEPYWACLVVHNTAMIYEDMGRYQDALDLYHFTITTYPTLTELSDHIIDRMVAITRCNQATNLALLGQFEDAYRLQQQARASFVALGDTSCVIKTEMCLADLDYTHGYYASTLRHYYDALELMARDAIDEPPLQALLKLCMAKCYMKLDRVQEACQVAEEAVAIQRQLGISLQTSNALREYAAILIAAGKSQEALSTFAEAITLFNKGGLDYHTAITKLQQAELLLEMGRAAEAFEKARLLKREFDGQNLVARSAQAGLVMAGALKATAQSHEVPHAIILGKQIAARARRHNLHETAYKSHYLLGQLFDLQKDVPNATKHYAASIVQIEHMLDHLAFDLSPAFLHTTWVIYEEMIEHCLQQAQFAQAFGYLEQARSMALRQHLRRTKASQGHQGQRSAHTRPADDVVAVSQTDGATILRLQKELGDWQEQYRQYSALLADPSALTPFSLDLSVAQQELARCEAKLSELFERLHLYQSTVAAPSQSRHYASPDRLDIAQLQRQLGPEQCLLAYFVYKGKLVMFLLTAESLITRQDAEGGSRLEHLLPILHAHLQPAGWPDLSRPPQAAIRGLLQKLHAILFAPLADLLPPLTRSLVIVPFGNLHDLPFHALYDGTQFLIERFQVSYLPASSLMSDLYHVRSHSKSDSASAPAAPAATAPAVIFGYAGKEHELQTLNEATTLAAMLDGRCYLGQEATIARLIEQAPGSPIIHIATHGRARLDAPQFSSVLLADGQFTAIDAFQLDVQACQLVTLSGCDTGKALIGGGDEQLGLGRAFLAAGARSLVMSLWPVEDQATTLLMQQFYQHLLDGKTKAEALRAAQCHFLQHSTSMNAMYTHPYFWAAFRLVGDTGPLPASMCIPTAASQATQATQARGRERRAPKTHIPIVP